jgi:hypothetical protein
MTCPLPIDILPYRVNDPPNTQTCKKKSFITKARRRGDVAPFLSNTPFEKIKNNFFLHHVPIKINTENYLPI